MSNRGDGSIDPNKLKALFGAAQRARSETEDINTEFAKDRKAAVEEHGLHARAFNMCVGIARLDQVKRLALLTALDNYRHILQLDEAPQGELLAGIAAQARAA